MRMKELLLKLQEVTAAENRRVIIGLLEVDKSAKYLDLGCNDGRFTPERDKKIGTDNLYGVEINKKQARQAEQIGIKVTLADLNHPLPIEDESFDVVCANQVLEHIYNTDCFVREIHRVLKPGGYAVISVPNLAAAHNIIFLILGQQPIGASLSDELSDVGNPFGPMHGVKREVVPLAHAHLRLPTPKALRELFQYHGFEIERLVRVGYYPFPVVIARLLCHLDPLHPVYVTIKARKK